MSESNTKLNQSEEFIENLSILFLFTALKLGQGLIPFHVLVLGHYFEISSSGLMLGLCHN